MRTRALLRSSFQGIRCISGPYRPYQRLRIEKSSAWLGAHALRDPADEVNSGPTMDNGAVDKNALVERLHSTPTKLVVFVSGGGSQAISDMLVVPGASATVLEARVPYAMDATQELLGQTVTSFCSQESAVLMARRAYQRAAHLTPPGVPILGISCTAALRTGKEKRGDHRMHIACHTGMSTATYDVTLEKNARTRAEEETVCSNAVLSVAAFHSGVAVTEIPAWPNLLHTTGADVVKEGSVDCIDPIQALLDGHIRCVEFSGSPDDRHVVLDAPRRGALILPGSFNPLHAGHRELLAAADRAVGGDTQGMFELCVRNPDKGAITIEEIHKRLVPFQEQGLTVVLTDAPLYTLKAQLFEGARFVLGYDTAVRIVMHKYYGNSEARMAADFATLHAAGCGFIVGGRVDGNTGRFLGLHDINVPKFLQDMGVKFDAIAEDAFRLDISSTELRRAAEQKE